MKAVKRPGSLASSAAAIDALPGSTDRPESLANKHQSFGNLPCGEGNDDFHRGICALPDLHHVVPFAACAGPQASRACRQAGRGRSPYCRNGRPPPGSRAAAKALPAGRSRKRPLRPWRSDRHRAVRDARQTRRHPRRMPCADGCRQRAAASENCGRHTANRAACLETVSSRLAPVNVADVSSAQPPVPARQ